MEKVQHLKALKRRLKHGRELNIVSSSFKMLMVIELNIVPTEIHKQLLIVLGARNRNIGNHRSRLEMAVFCGKHYGCHDSPLWVYHGVRLWLVRVQQCWMLKLMFDCLAVLCLSTLSPKCMFS